MQIGFELALTANLLSAIVSAGVSVFLFHLWTKQENRIITDLPLLFSITFIAMTLNSALQAVTLAGVVHDTLEVFRVRAFIISGSALPLLAAILNIWFPRFNHYHKRIILLSILYWVVVVILVPTEIMIMTLLIPLLLVFSLGMLITFSITWKTGRLKEVRNDLMVISLALGFISQAFKIPLQNAGLDWFTVSIAALTAVIAGIALANPWFRRKVSKYNNSLDLDNSL